MEKFWSELRRRDVVRVAVIYVVAGWIGLQAAALLEDALSLPGWFDAAIFTVIVLGFPAALAFAWFYDFKRLSFETSAPASPALRQTIGYCTAPDGARIAYATVGDGPPLVKTSNWLNHLEYDWESPVWRHVFRALSEDHELIRYDSRGNGLSDRDVEDFSFEAMVGDLEAVVAATGLTTFPLMGISQGCSTAIEFAARHPEQVTKLVLYGGYARGWRAAGTPETIAENEAMITLMRTGWGRDNPAFRQIFTSMFIPEGTPEHIAWFNELQRITTNGENAARLMHAFGPIDVSDRLALVRAPTLVLHVREDARVPFDRGRELAKGIPDAHFVALEGRNHLLLENDKGWPRFVDEVSRFLAEP